MPSRTLRLGVGLTAATLLITMVPSVASAAPPDTWGYAVVREPGRASYTLPDKDRWSNPAGLVKVQRTGKGRHVVHFDGLTMEEGNVQVTALSGDGGICHLEAFDGGIAGLDVLVWCFSRGGVRRDVAFIVNAIASFNQDDGPQTAYLYSGSSIGSWTPSRDNFSTAGPPGMITRASAGRYEVRFADIDDSGGNVQVVAAGSKAYTCRIKGWSQDGNDHVGQVVCRNRSGVPSDTHFSYLFTNDEGMKGAWGPSYAYLMADKPKKTNYVPSAWRRSADPASRPHVRRLSKGRYLAKLPSMPLGGAVQVTPMGFGKGRCNVSGIRKTGAPQRIGVRCFKLNGAPLDTRFSLSYLR
jgi:hypothetical protein